MAQGTEVLVRSSPATRSSYQPRSEVATDMESHPTPPLTFKVTKLANHVDVVDGLETAVFPGPRLPRESPNSRNRGAFFAGHKLPPVDFNLTSPAMEVLGAIQKQAN